MRDLHFPGRSPVRSMNAMAATSQPASTLAAIEIMRQGGNAMDAAVAACAVQCVVEPQSTGIGGDCFCLYAPAGENRVIGLNGSGKAPGKAEAGWFLEQGISGRVDMWGPHAVTVPGAVDAWITLLDDHGTMGIDQVLQPAIHYAENGFVVHSRTSADWASNMKKLLQDPDSSTRFTKSGAPLAEGDVFVQPQLAETFRRIAKEGRDGFYKGPVAEDIVKKLNSLGGLHTLDDLAATACKYVDPIKTGYGDYEVWEIPPNGVGIITLLLLNILSGYDLTKGGPTNTDRLHHLIEAAKLAYRDRNTYVADPDFADVPVDALLSLDYAASLREQIDPDRAMKDVPPPSLPNDDTVYLCVVDKDGNACSFINSLFQSFGSGILAPESGVMLQNRGYGFVVEEGHPNCIAPGKRPLHTIIPAMLTKGGRAQMPFGVMGGHFQPFGQTYFLTNLLDFGLDIQQSFDLSRLFCMGGDVEVERSIPAEAVHGLMERGHKCSVINKPHGGGQGIWIDWEKGTLAGGSEPRKDGCAMGY